MIQRAQFLRGRPIGRRSFLQSSTCALAWALLSRPRKAFADGAGQRVIVVGAGLAGLAAARALQARGFVVLVLEARARVGGRVWTDSRWPDLPVDLGASRIHGSDDNPLADLAREFGVATKPMTGTAASALYGPAGERLSHDQSEALRHRLGGLLEAAESLRENQESDGSLQDALDQAARAQGLGPVELLELAYAVASEIEIDRGADAARLSLRYWDHGDTFDGDELVIPGGFGQITDALARGLDIRPGQTVRKIAWDVAGVRVTTGDLEHQADRVVVTVPLGVLQRGDLVFEPGLPDSKLGAMQRLGMGLLNKVYLRYPDVFWDEDSHLLGHLGERRGEWVQFVNLFALTGQPVLCGLNAGLVGRQMEDLGDPQIIDSAQAVLQTLYGDNIPRAGEALVTRWASDPLARGSFSFMAVGSTPEDRLALAEPLDGRVFFAGEATSPQYAATTHGAYLSGLRAAEEVAGLQ